MATFEQVGLVTQTIANIYGLVNNMRDNAANYKDRVAAGQPIASIRDMMVGDANQYVRRIQWITNVVTRNQALFTNALAVWGLTLAEANSLKTTLTNVCNHTLAASLTTGAEVNTEADFQLATVPNFERVF